LGPSQKTLQQANLAGLLAALNSLCDPLGTSLSDPSGNPLFDFLLDSFIRRRIDPPRLIAFEFQPGFVPGSFLWRGIPNRCGCKINCAGTPYRGTEVIVPVFPVVAAARPTPANCFDRVQRRATAAKSLKNTGS
jgi:hypothetical protein